MNSAYYFITKGPTTKPHNDLISVPKLLRTTNHAKSDKSEDDEYL